MDVRVPFLLKLIVPLILMVGYYFPVYRLFLKLRAPLVKRYFEINRPKFPWLDEQMKQEEGKIETDSLEGDAFFYAVLSVLIGGIPYFLITLIASSINPLTYIPVFLLFVGVPTLIVIPFSKMKPHYDECPQCGCPLAWKLLGEWDETTGVEKKTQKIVTDNSSNFTDAMLGMGRKVTYRTRTITSGTKHSQYHCDSCGYSKHEEYKYTKES